MATEYEAPSRNNHELDSYVVQSPAARPSGTFGPVIDLDEAELADSYELPGGDLSGEELAVEVLREQADEFTCSSCFLVRHRSQLVREQDGQVGS